MYPVRSISSKKGAFHLSRPASIYRLLPHWHCSSPGRPQGSPPTLPDPFWSWLTRYRRGQNHAQAVALPVGLLLPPPLASPSWDRGASSGCPAGGSALSALIAVRLRCGVRTLVVAL